jgi:hypothetical protein
MECMVECFVEAKQGLESAGWRGPLQPTRNFGIPRPLGNSQFCSSGRYENKVPGVTTVTLISLLDANMDHMDRSVLEVINDLD